MSVTKGKGQLLLGNTGVQYSAVAITKSSWAALVRNLQQMICQIQSLTTECGVRHLAPLKRAMFNSDYFLYVPITLAI